MEKYKASKNNIDSADELSQDEKNIESNKKILDSAKEIGKRIPIPHVQAAAHAIDKIDKFTGGKASGAIAKGVNNLSKVNPAMNQIQNISNEMNRTGASSTVNNTTSLTSVKSKNNSNFLSGNIMSKLSIAKSLKVKLIIGGAVIGFFGLFLVVMLSSVNFHALDLTNRSEMARKSASSKEVLVALEDVANWYIQNVKVYDQSKYMLTPFSGVQARADCTGFAIAYMAHVSGADIPDSYTLEMIDISSNFSKTVNELGWIPYSSDEIGELQPGDVLIADHRNFYSTKGEHAEIYIDESHTFGWGSAKTSYPTNNVVTKSEFDGHVHFMDNNNDYITIYRYAGAVFNQDNTSTNESETTVETENGN